MIDQTKEFIDSIRYSVDSLDIKKINKIKGLIKNIQKKKW